MSVLLEPRTKVSVAPSPPPIAVVTLRAGHQAITQHLHTGPWHHGGGGGGGGGGCEIETEHLPCATVEGEVRIFRR